MKNQTTFTETINVMQNHSSVRHYKDEPIPAEHFDAIIKAAQGAASSNFVQAYTIINVTDAALKEQIIEHANNKPQISQCSHFLVFCADFKRLQQAGEMQGVMIEADNVESLLVTVVDTALVAQNTITAAESLGYGGCYIGGIRNNPAAISELLNLPDLVFPLFGLTLGVPAKINDVKPRLPKAAILHENTYNSEEYEDVIRDYDKTMQEYYSARSSNMKDSNWSKTMAAFLAQKKREHMKEFLENKGFNKK